MTQKQKSPANRKPCGRLFPAGATQADLARAAKTLSSLMGVPVTVHLPKKKGA